MHHFRPPLGDESFAVEVKLADREVAAQGQRLEFSILASQKMLVEVNVMAGIEKILMFGATFIHVERG